MALARGAPGSFAASDWQSWYRAADFFVVRSPLLPLQRALTWSAGARARGSDEQSLLSSRLLAELAEPALREALFFASPDLERSLGALTNGAPPSVKLLRSLTRYFLRAAGRETPFGLFAGISLGKIGGNDCLELGAESTYRRQARVAPSFLTQLVAALGSLPTMHYELSSTLTLVQGTFRFTGAEPGAVAGKRDVNAIVELGATAMLQRLVEHAQRSITATALSHELLQGELAYEDVLAFVLTLCERGFLVPTCLPAATGEAMLDELIQRLRGYPELVAVTAQLESVRGLVLEANGAAIGDAQQSLQAARTGLAALSEVEALKQPLQADLVKPAPNMRLSTALAQRFLAAAELLQRTGRNPPLSHLVEFRERFVQRYEQRCVPLLEALDRDVGIGFESFEGFPRDAFLNEVRVAPKPQLTRSFDAHDRARLKLWQRALERDEPECELDRELLESFPMLGQPPLPESFSVMARLARTQHGLRVVAPIVSAPSALSTLARFGEAEPALGAALRRHAQLEQDLAGDVLLADVAYLPHDDSAQVVARPGLRGFEIPLLGRSSAPPEKQIRLSQLLVGVEGDRVVLYDAQRGKRVKIRLASAHNFSSPACPVAYRFFGALQLQDEGDLVSAWSWGVLEDSDYLPRVVCDDCVLSVARFRLDGEALKPALAAKGAQAFELVQALRERRRLPRLLTRPEGDQRLPVDLDNELSVEELLHAARQRSGVVLEELLPGPDELALRGEAGDYCAELVVPFLRSFASNASLPGLSFGANLDTQPGERRHSLGSSWLYAKIYASRSRLDRVLELVRAGVVEPLFGNALELWFFLPYADPEPHLRLRFCGDPRKLQARVLPYLQRVLAPLLAEGSVWRITLDTYEQELERYGGKAGMALAERVFWADSEAVSRLQQLCADDDDLRWQLALLGIDRLLVDFGYDVAERGAFASYASEAYGHEVGADGATWRAIAEKYRQFSDVLSELLWQSEAGSSEVLRAAHAILRERSERLLAVRGAFEAEIPVSRDDLLRSFCHLHAMRLLGLAGRSFELLLYDFLRRQYRSHTALEQKKAGLALAPS